MGRLPNLAAGGRALAPGLASYAQREDAVVLGIVRGGVPAAAQVAGLLGLPLDLLLIRRLLLPHGPADPLCAVHAAGRPFRDPELDERTADPSTQVFGDEALAAFANRVEACRGSIPGQEVAGKVVILVDNGVHTGGTFRIAVRAVRALGAARVVAALPFAAPECRAELEGLADEVVCLAWPASFGNVALWYDHYHVPEVEEVRATLERSHQRRTAVHRTTPPPSGALHMRKEPGCAMQPSSSRFHVVGTAGPAADTPTGRSIRTYTPLSSFSTKPSRA